MATITKHRFEFHPDDMKIETMNEIFNDNLFDIPDLCGSDFTFSQDWDNGIIIITTQSTNNLNGVIPFMHEHYITEV